MKLLLAKVKGQFVASSKKRKERNCVLSDKQKIIYTYAEKYKRKRPHELSKKNLYMYIYIYT